MKELPNENNSLNSGFEQNSDLAYDCEDSVLYFFPEEFSDDFCYEHPSFYNQSYDEEISHIRQLLKNRQMGFSQAIFAIISEKNLDEVSVYKQAHLDRKLFSKLRNTPDYQPSRTTAIALCLALNLALEETEQLLQKAGFALSDASEKDIALKYCISHQIYSILAVNEILFSLNLPLLTQN